MQFTTVRIKEKDYDIYLKSEKLYHSKEKDQEHEKNVSCIMLYVVLFKVRKTVSQQAQEHEKNVSQLFGSA